jgi:hypothetical protein
MKLRQSTAALMAAVMALGSASPVQACALRQSISVGINEEFTDIVRTFTGQQGDYQVMTESNGQGGWLPNVDPGQLAMLPWENIDQANAQLDDLLQEMKRLQVYYNSMTMEEWVASGGSLVGKEMFRFTMADAINRLSQIPYLLSKNSTSEIQPAPSNPYEDVQK